MSRSDAPDEIPDQLLLLEHPAVLTLGRHADASHVLASEEELEQRGIEVIRVERGGEVTYHGPGQLVAYPIIRLAARGILLRPFVRTIEQAMIDTAAGFGVSAARRDGYPGAGAIQRQRLRASSGRSGCASRAESRTTALP